MNINRVLLIGNLTVDPGFFEAGKTKTTKRVSQQILTSLREKLADGSATTDENDRDRLIQTLGEACGNTGWLMHAWVLMDNHYHVVIETPLQDEALDILPAATSAK